MATPQPASSGDAREDHAQSVADAAGVICAGIELVLIATIASLARKVAAGAMPSAGAAWRLSQSVTAAFRTVGPRLQVTTGPDAQLVLPIVSQTAETVASSAQDALQAAVTAASTNAADLSPYQQAVSRAIGSVRSGLPGSPLSLSRVQAAQKALDDLASQGLTGFVDRTGRRWSLASYVEMATRTAVSNAWDEHQAAALVRAGVDLVIVGTHSTEGSCPHCLPWLGRTLSLTGATPGHPTLADAKAAGFRHPNCRCSWAPIGVGLAAEVTNPVAPDRAAAAYKASQRQRALERRVRAAHRATAAAITPAARAKARRDLNAARAVAEQHRQRAGLVMTRAHIWRRQDGFRAH